MRYLKLAVAVTLVLAAAAATPAVAAAQEGTPGVTKMSAKLRAGAKISDDSARAVALREVPGGTIAEGELEKEHGKLVYSYDIRVAGKDGVEEVQVDAVTGRMVSHEHETPKKERREAKREHGAAKRKP